MRRLLLPILLATLAATAGCASAQLAMPEGFAAQSERMPVSGLSPRRHDEPIRFGPYSALEMREGGRFGWAFPLGIATMTTASQRWSFTQIALHQPPVETQCLAKGRALHRTTGSARSWQDIGIDTTTGPLLACGFHIDGEDAFVLRLHRKGHRLEGEAAGDQASWRIASLHGLQGTRIRSGLPTGYEVLDGERTLMVVDRVNAGSVSLHAAVDARERIALAALASALLLFDPEFDEI